MEFGNYHPSMLPILVGERVFADEPFFLADVGCAGGIDELWRLFGDQFQAVGFDPQQSEIERLRTIESNPSVTFVPALVGLEASHDFHVRKQARPQRAPQYFCSLPRSSAASLWDSGIALQSNVVGENVVTMKVGLSDYARTHRIERVDFIKIDTDGADLEAAISAEDIIRPCGVLGFLIETPFSGSHEDTENSFHNIDRLMRHHGYMPYVIALRSYSRAALPAPFVYDIAAQTVSGQPQWADVVYLRDAAVPDYALIWGEAPSPTVVLKLAALCELFRLPDCAAELILVHHDRIKPLTDPERLLDALTPPFQGQRLSYREYVELFRRSPDRFFPRAFEAGSGTSAKRGMARLFGR